MGLVVVLHRRPPLQLLRLARLLLRGGVCRHVHPVGCEVGQHSILVPRLIEWRHLCACEVQLGFQKRHVSRGIDATLHLHSGLRKITFIQQVSEVSVKHRCI